MSDPVPLDDLADRPESEQVSREWAETRGGQKASLVAKVRQEITSLEQLLDFFEVDRTLWEVERWACNQWQQAAKVGPVNDCEIVVTPLYQVKATFVRRKDYQVVAADVEALIEDAASVLLQSKKLPAPRRNRKKKPFLFVPSIMDPHFGKLCWGRETGWENYDVDTASRLVLEAASDLADQASHYEIREILFPVGNDFFHVDSGKNQTTRGTDQDVDGRWFRAYRHGRRVIMEVITALEQIAPVKVVIVPGNHDMERALTLGDALEMAFRSQRHIEVDCEPTMRKYHAFGKVLLGLEHGLVKRNRLQGIMQTEMREMWGQAQHCEWLLGHYHKKTEYLYKPVDEDLGVRFRHIPSLTPPDFWHANAGYVGGVRAAEGLIYHEELGYRAQFSYTPRD